ncbi:MAG: HAD-IIIA family hydrolase [Zetaproteobacteria bacterium]|nr:HAD-IIIA family hydrolase [Zetaproteobacteria bacterium]
MNKTCLLFDCDGTLTDSLSTIVRAMQYAFTAASLPVPKDAEVASIIGLSLDDAVHRLQAPDGLNDAIANHYKKIYKELEQEVQLFDGVIETLECLNASGYHMGVVTGKSKAGMFRVMDRFALWRYFSVVRSADCCPSKPHPAMVLEAMAACNVTAQETLVVGDSIFDVTMARAAGAEALGVSFGVASADELYQAGARHVIDHFTSVLQYVEKKY